MSNNSIHNNETLFQHEHCMPMCVYQGQHADQDMVQCCLCTRWYHYECVALDTNHDSFWPCPYCRTISAEIRTIKSNQQDFKESLNFLRKTITKLHSSLEVANRQLDHKTIECDRMAQENAALRQRIDTLVTEQSKRNWEKFTTKKSLLVGDSTVKDIDERKLRNTKVICLQGGRIDTVHEVIQTRNEKYDNVTLCVGSNDCTDEVEDLDTLIPKYKELISSTQRLVTHPKQIVVSSVLPRCKEPKVQEFIDDFNEDLEKLAMEKGATFVNNDREFKLLNRSPNAALFLQDGIHPTYNAINCLAKNLQLDVSPRNKDDVCKRWGGRQRGTWNSHKQMRQTHPNQNRYHPHTSPRHQMTPTQGQSSGHHQSRLRHSPEHYKTNGPRTKFHSQNRPKCWNCGEANHMARNCRHRQSVTCHQCGEKGHKLKFCGHNRQY